MEDNLLQLAEDEFVVFEKEEFYVVMKEEEYELMISNQNIYLFQEHSYLFKKSTYDIIKWPLLNIKIIDGLPQVSVELGEYSSWNVVILFSNGIKRFGVPYSSVFKKNEGKKEAERIAESISQLCLQGTIVLKKNLPFVKKIYNEELVSDKQTLKNEGYNKSVNVQESLHQRLCQYCGVKIVPGSKYCSSCGASLVLSDDEPINDLIEKNLESNIIEPSTLPFSKEATNHDIISTKTKNESLLKLVENDKAILEKNGYKDYEIIYTPDEVYYFDFKIQRFAINNSYDLKFYKFKDYKKYIVTDEDSSSFSKFDVGGSIGGTLGGAIKGGFTGKSLLGKSAIRIGAVVGGVIGGITGGKLNIGGKVRLTVEIVFREYTLTMHFSDPASFEDYQSLFKVLDRVEVVNKSTKKTLF